MAQTHKVDINQMKFIPASVKIAKGDTVEWTNQMTMDHTATADNGEFNSGHIKPGKTFSHVFDTSGPVPYHCEIHPFMKGTVDVT
jgi:plastocyanin